MSNKIIRAGQIVVVGGLGHCLYADTLRCFIQLPANVLGNAASDGPRPWAPALVWETQMKFLGPGFSLACPWPLWPFGE